MIMVSWDVRVLGEQPHRDHGIEGDDTHRCRPEIPVGEHRGRQGGRRQHEQHEPQYRQRPYRLRIADHDQPPASAVA
jgi:hypothetical protein